MTTLPEATEAIYQRFVTGWDISDAVYTFDGEQFEEPDAEPWVRISVRNVGSTQESLGQVGNRKFERIASVIFNIFTPANEGVGSGLVLAQLLLGLFEAVNFSGLRFFESDVREQGTDGLWYGVVVESKFTYNETK
jgi:hypothetical protein